MTKEKEELEAKLEKVRIEPQELRDLSKETASKLSKAKKEILKVLESEDKG